MESFEVGGDSYAGHGTTKPEANLPQALRHYFCKVLILRDLNGLCVAL